MELIDILSLPYPALEAVVAHMGEPAYRAGQIFGWLGQGAGFEEMTNLPKALRQRLAAECRLAWPRVVARQEDPADQTVKYLLELEDQNRVESVLMQYRHGASLCLSTQAGCRMGCVFCASFDPEAARNLTAGEMLGQVAAARRDGGRAVNNLVLMGTGEPLDNFDNVMDFLAIVSDTRGLGLGMRHISLSTCGLVPGIDALAQRRLGLTLSVSLHAPNDALRSQLMPINHKYPVAALMAACTRYFETTGRRISFEYAMIAGVNDSEGCARELAALLRGMNCHVNLIPLNRVAGSALAPAGRGAIDRFRAILEGKHIPVTVRRSLGGQIDAACGQLRKSRAADMRAQTEI